MFLSRANKQTKNEARTGIRLAHVIRFGIAAFHFALIGLDGGRKCFGVGKCADGRASECVRVSE